MSEEREIPKGWEFVQFKDVCDIISGKNQKNVADENGNFPIYGSGGIMGKANDFLCEPGTTIIGRKGTINSPIFVKHRFWNVDTAFGLSPNRSYDKLLFHFFCLSFNFKKLDKSTTIPSLAKTDLQQINIPLPPLPEQHRIVAKIEELFSSLDKGIESLKTAQEQLKVYRQAVLKWAFEGKLTNKDVKEGELPEGWKKFKVKELGKVINGDRGKNYPSRAHYVESGVPFISAGNIEENRIDTNGLNFITQQKYDALNSGRLKNGDLIYCLRGSLGKCAIFNLNMGAISSSLCILRLNNEIFNQYVFYYLISPFGRDEILKHDNGTAQPNLSGKSFENYDILLPPLSEQEHIVSEIESRLSVCDKIEESISTSLQQAEALRQSILKKAFEGKLVEQDPNDEPASVLLERIKTEREALRLAQGKNKLVKKVRKQKLVNG
jgi:type I restriction enzyme S subunit